MNQQNFTSVSSDSLEESLLPRTENEAEIIFGGPARPVEGAAPVKLGGADLSPASVGTDIEEQGMIMGPSHPVFNREIPQNHRKGPLYPDLPVPPGARFDPISPVGPGFYSPGDPDFDEMLPPGGPTDPLAHSVRPPHKSKSGSATFRPPSGFGHPHGAPPGPGNPPFFM
jgi:hypothetical protein